MKPTLVFTTVFFITLTIVHAQVVIHQVLIQPLDGQEAIELYNPSNETINISSWRIATKTSNHDATIPPNTLLQPQEYYLITDPGWNTSKFRNADHKETITLANNDAGVALYTTENTLIDALGWGDPPRNLFESSATPQPREGYSLTRIQDTNNNFEDFEERAPFFPPHTSIRVQGIITTTITRLHYTVTDNDNSTTGIQIVVTPGKNSDIVIQFSTPTPIGTLLRFRGKDYPVINTTGIVPLPFTTPPGEHTLLIDTGTVQETIPFTVLPLTHVSFSTTQLTVTKNNSKTILHNTGNTLLDLRLIAHDLIGEQESITFTKLSYSLDNIHYFPFDTKEKVVSLRLPPNARQELYVRLDNEVFAQPGRYQGFIEVVGIRSN